MGLTLLGMVHTILSLVAVVVAIVAVLREHGVPPGAPIVAGPDAPIFEPLYLVLVVLFLVGVSMQFRRLRSVATARWHP